MTLLMFASPLQAWDYFLLQPRPLALLRELTPWGKGELPAVRQPSCLALGESAAVKLPCSEVLQC